ncbi:MAG: class I SAM-dependent methyltransferase, partial [Thermoanaerobaculia bacterium]
LATSAEFRTGSAEQTGAGDGSFNLVTAGNCWHWFDPSAAMAEIGRVLRPGGFLVIAHYAYLARHSPLARQTEELILRFNPSWTMAGESGVHPDEIDTVIRGGFRFVEAFSWDEPEKDPLPVGTGCAVRSRAARRRPCLTIDMSPAATGPPQAVPTSTASRSDHLP